MAHSGWRGTVKKIGAKFVAYMQNEYGSKPENIIAAIICLFVETVMKLVKKLQMHLRKCFCRRKYR